MTLHASPLTTAEQLAAACASGTGLLPWSIACAALGIAIVATLWAWTERQERKAWQKRNDALSTACRTMSEQHYRERLNAEERHLLAFDSTVRNILESLERSLVG